MMTKKGQLEEVLSKAIYSDNTDLYNIVYNNFGLPMEVSLKEWLEVKAENSIPDHRILTITRDGEIVFKKFGKRAQAILDILE